jgi:hypothetical protein
MLGGFTAAFRSSAVFLRALVVSGVSGVLHSAQCHQLSGLGSLGAWERFVSTRPSCREYRVYTRRAHSSQVPQHVTSHPSRPACN